MISSSFEIDEPNLISTTLSQNASSLIMTSRSIKRWDLVKKKSTLLQHRIDNKFYLDLVFIDNDKKGIFIVNPDGLEIWDLNKNRKISTIKLKYQGLSLRVTLDEKYLYVGCHRSTIIMINLEKMEIERSIDLSSINIGLFPVRYFSLIEKKDLIAINNMKSIILLNLDFKIISVIYLDKKYFTRDVLYYHCGPIIYDDISDKLICGLDNAILSISLENEEVEELISFKGEDYSQLQFPNITDLAISPDGKYLLWGEYNNTLILSKYPEISIIQYFNSVYNHSLGFIPNLNQFFSANSNKVYLFSIP